MPNHKETLLSVSEAALDLGITPQHVRLLCRNNKLRAERVGKTWVISASELSSFRRDSSIPSARKHPYKLSGSFIDLFAGIGGTRIGFEKAGARCVFSSEWDKYSQITYSANFGEQPEGDIRAINADNIPDHDILVAGFPCQPFSIAGVTKKNSLGMQHGFKDETQGTLFFEIVRILDAKRPNAFLLENVKNLVSHDSGNTFRVIQGALRELGYYAHYRVIDARGLVPQHRERIFMVGFRDNVPFSFPQVPDTGIRMKNILEPRVDAKYTLTDHLWDYLQAYAEKHRAKGNGFGYGLVDLNGISRTISARYHKDGAEVLIPQKGKNPRRLTPRESARLMGFPDSFQIVVSDTQAYRQFGNSVVVPLIEMLAIEIMKSVSILKGVGAYGRRSVA